MRTRYKIDSYQPTYFVIDSLRELTAPDFTPIYERVKGLAELEPGVPEATPAVERTGLPLTV